MIYTPQDAPTLCNETHNPLIVPHITRLALLPSTVVRLKRGIAHHLRDGRRSLELPLAIVGVREGGVTVGATEDEDLLTGDVQDRAAQGVVGEVLAQDQLESAVDRADVELHAGEATVGECGGVHRDGAGLALFGLPQGDDDGVGVGGLEGGLVFLGRGGGCGRGCGGGHVADDDGGCGRGDWGVAVVGGEGRVADDGAQAAGEGGLVLVLEGPAAVVAVGEGRVEVGAAGAEDEVVLVVVDGASEGLVGELLAESNLEEGRAEQVADDDLGGLAGGEGCSVHDHVGDDIVLVNQGDENALCVGVLDGGLVGGCWSAGGSGGSKALDIGLRGGTGESRSGEEEERGGKLGVLHLGSWCGEISCLVLIRLG